MFKKAQRVLSKEEIEALGESLLDAKQRKRTIGAI
jgi:hypothetical protein